MYICAQPRIVLITLLLAATFAPSNQVAAQTQGPMLPVLPGQENSDSPSRAEESLNWVSLESDTAQGATREGVSKKGVAIALAGAGLAIVGYLVPFAENPDQDQFIGGLDGERGTANYVLMVAGGALIAGGLYLAYRSDDSSLVDQKRPGDSGVRLGYAWDF